VAVSNDRNRFVASVAGALELLEVFGELSGPASLTALAAATGRPKSSVHRALSTLLAVGFVEQDPDTSLYRLTLKMWRIGMSALSDLDLVKLARPHLENLMAAADETVHLSVLDPSGDVVYVAKVESPRSIRVQTQLGKLNRSWSTATGRAIIAFLPHVADQVLKGRLEPNTPHTVTDPARIRTLLAEVARKGVAISKRENHPEMGGIAAPIRQHAGEVVASCGVAIPIFRMDRRLVERSIPLVIQTANAISAELGAQPETKSRRHGS
jgi:DNA-binding IclR family transcriptional regulator